MAHARAGGLVSYTTASHTGCCRACNSQSTHSPLSWACGREQMASCRNLRSAQGVACTVTRIRWPPAWPSACERVCHREQLASERDLQSAQGVACTVTVLRLRAWTSVPCTVLGPCVQYKSMPDLGLSGVQPTVNSQSTHSQLDSQLTVNSQSTRQSTQRTPGPPNPGILSGLVEKGWSSALTKKRDGRTGPS